MGSVAVKEKKVKDFSVDDVLAAASSTTEKAGKSKVPVMSVPKEVMEKVARLRDVKAELDSYQSMYDTLAAELVTEVAPGREKLCVTQGYVSSVKVPGARGTSVSVSWSSMYSKTDASSAGEIRGVVGERYDEFFAPAMEITVKDGISEDMLRELIAAVGPEEFARYFDVKRWVKPLPRYTAEFFSAFTPEQRQKLSGIVRQYKPSVRTK